MKIIPTITFLTSMIMCPCLAQDTTALLVINNIPLMHGTINNKPAYFVVDTGASVTLLNASQGKEYNFVVRNNRYLDRAGIVGISGSSMLKEAWGVTVVLGSHQLNFINRAADLDNIAAQFNSYGVSVAGIIGTDLLRILGSKIDLEEGVIIFTRVNPRPNVTRTGPPPSCLACRQHQNF